MKYIKLFEDHLTKYFIRILSGKFWQHPTEAIIETSIYSEVKNEMTNEIREIHFYLTENVIGRKCSYNLEFDKKEDEQNAKEISLEITNDFLYLMIRAWDNYSNEKFR